MVNSALSNLILQESFIRELNKKSLIYFYIIYTTITSLTLNYICYDYDICDNYVTGVTLFDLYDYHI